MAFAQQFPNDLDITFVLLSAWDGDNVACEKARMYLGIAVRC